MTIAQTSAAIGSRVHDFMQLSNQWARVTITRHDEPTEGRYAIEGDLMDTRARVIYRNTVDEALRYALASLALYASGRCD